MAVLKMQRISICALKKDRKAILEKLQSLGVWSVGVIMGSNELGLTEEETRTLPMGELKCRMAKVRDRMYAAGADYVVDTIAELPMLIEDINERMAL